MSERWADSAWPFLECDKPRLLRQCVERLVKEHPPGCGHLNCPECEALARMVQEAVDIWWVWNERANETSRMAWYRNDKKETHV
jgi:hypothetical protein